MNFSFVDINYLCLYLEHMVRVCTECRIYWIFRQCLLCLCICALFVLTLYQPTHSCFSVQSSEAYGAWMPHFSHTTQEMNIQTKTLSWRLNFGHFEEMLYFAVILFKFCQAKIPEWFAISFSRRFSQPRNQAHISCISFIGRQVLYQLSHQGSPRCLQFYIIIESRRLLSCCLQSELC